jgi:hypothetical protein
MATNVVEADCPWLIEARYFAGGLETARLPPADGRPAWVPPTSYVGFRNEFQLGHADCVVEIARFAYAGERVNWVAVYGRSADAVHGDRGNVAGTGVWLRDHDVQAADSLLHGLKVINALVIAGQIGEAGHGAAQFLDPDYLPKYVRRAGRLAPGLAGWCYSDSQLPATSLFLAVAGEEREAWALAAEQVQRVSLLPGPSPRHSRAMILVRVGGLAAAQAPSEVQALEPTLARDLVATLPGAFDEERAQGSAERSELAALRQRSGVLETTIAELGEQLAGANERLEEARQRAATLEGQISEDDLRLRLGSMDQLLRAINGRTERADSQLHMIGRRLEQLNRPPLSPLRRADTEEPRTRAQPDAPPPLGRYSPYIWVVIGLMVGAGIAWAFYWALADGDHVSRDDGLGSTILEP